MQNFKIKKAATQYLDNLVITGQLSQHSKGYSPIGRYELAHGEYAKPDYKPVRYKDGWAIKAVYYYHTGTHNTPIDGRVEVGILQAYEGVNLLEVIPICEL